MLLIWLEAEVDGQVVNRNLGLFGRPKHLKLAKPSLKTSVKDGVVSVSSDLPALWVRLETTEVEAHFADNWFHLDAGQTLEVAVRSDADDATLAEQIRATSVVDTWK